MALAKFVTRWDELFRVNRFDTESTCIVTIVPIQVSYAKTSITIAKQSR